MYTKLKDNEKLQIINKNGIKIAILNYTFGTNGLKPENKYQINYLNENKIKRDVKYAKNIVMLSSFQLIGDKKVIIIQIKTRKIC